VFVNASKFIQYFFPSLVWRKDNSENNIWLTFDDGPTPEVTPYILQVLNQEKIKATFFLVGEQIEKFPNLVNDILSDGHLIANHSYSHKNGWLTSKEKYLKDIESCQQLMPQNKLFRPPYGKITTAQISLLKEKYKIILWDVLSWDFSKRTTPKRVKQNVLKNTKNGSIIVFHNNQKSFRNLRVLKETLQELKKEGFRFSTTW